MTVYVVQNQMHYDVTGKLVPKFDVEPARVFGEIVYLLSPAARPFAPESIIDELHEKLCKFTPDDHLLLIGNPCLIGFATAIAASYCNGPVKLLQWSGKDKRYLEIVAPLFDCSDALED